MKAIILAAGCATRLYPLTENTPKPLLEVKGKTILDRLIDDIDSTGMIEKHIVVPMQPGDVPVTYADTSALERDFGFKPTTSLRDGLRRFAKWYKEFYNC
ncbi:MAG: NTP transferase domain-containing protein [Clostridia bacterium]|nr:NTP transferase domain-containing protein [Clostridia bacterium]